ncbi:MAG: HEAT repeat domain-containing protein [Candidatus Nealsonbacteria bacterium]|nr:HEAT repeat domain-containing protein [Candidatus Nealsonbacteria bacterium]
MSAAEVARMYDEFATDVQELLDAGSSSVGPSFDDLEGRARMTRLGALVPEHKAFFRAQVEKNLFIAEYVLWGSKPHTEHRKEFDRLHQRYMGSVTFNTPNYDPRVSEKRKRAYRDLWLWILSDGKPESLPDPRQSDNEVEEEYAQARQRLGAKYGKAVLALVDSLMNNDHRVGRQAVEELVKTNPAGLVELIRAVGDQHDSHLTGRVDEELRKLGPGAKQAIPGLIRALRDEDEFVRASAVSILPGIGWEATAAVPELIRLLADSEQVQIQVIQTLQSLGSEARAAAPALVQVAQDQNVSRSLRQAATLALAPIGATKELAELLHNPNPDTRATAAWVLPAFGRVAVPDLTKALRDEDASVRREVARALKRIGAAAKEAIPELVNRLEDEDKSVRRAAADALKAIRAKPDLPVIP